MDQTDRVGGKNEGPMRMFNLGSKNETIPTSIRPLIS
jgi:hypothetical protein